MGHDGYIVDPQFCTVVGSIGANANADIPPRKKERVDPLAAVTLPFDFTELRQIYGVSSQGTENDAKGVMRYDRPSSQSVVPEAIDFVKDYMSRTFGPVCSGWKKISPDTVRPMMRGASSAGYPFQALPKEHILFGKKKQVFKDDDAKWRALIEGTLDMVENRDWKPQIWSLSTKIELLPVKKLIRPRAIISPPMPLYVLETMYAYDFDKRIKSVSKLLPYLCFDVGFSPYNGEGARAFTSPFPEGSYFVSESDLTSYDTTQCPALIEVELGLRLSTVSADEDRAEYEYVLAELFHQEAAGPVALPGGQVIETPHGMKSGCYRTSSSNSLRRIMAGLYAWFILAPKEMRTAAAFQANVRMRCQGDDELLFIRNECKWFNLEARKRVLEEHLGLIVKPGLPDSPTVIGHTYLGLTAMYDENDNLVAGFDQRRVLGGLLLPANGSITDPYATIERVLGLAIYTVQATPGTETTLGETYEKLRSVYARAIAAGANPMLIPPFPDFEDLKQRWTGYEAKPKPATTQQPSQRAPTPRYGMRRPTAAEIRARPRPELYGGKRRAISFNDKPPTFQFKAKEKFSRPLKRAMDTSDFRAREFYGSLREFAQILMVLRYGFVLLLLFSLASATCGGAGSVRVPYGNPPGQLSCMADDMATESDFDEEGEVYADPGLHVLETSSAGRQAGQTKAMKRRSRQVGLDPAAIDALMYMTDPLMDARRQLVPTPPSEETGMSLVQVVNRVVTIQKPPGLMPGNTWTANISYTPWSETFSPRMSELLIPNPIELISSVNIMNIVPSSLAPSAFSPGSEFGAITVCSGLDGIRTFDPVPGGADPPLYTGISPSKLDFSNDLMNASASIIAAGFEVIPTGPALTRSGSITTYATPSQVFPLPVYADAVVAAGVPVRVSAMATGKRAPPATLVEAALTPDSRTWAVRHGVYIPGVLDCDVPPRPTPAEPNNVLLVPKTMDPGYYTSATGLTCFSPVSGVAGKTFLQTNDFSTRGAFLEGLHENEVLTIKVRFYVWRMPEITDASSVALASVFPRTPYTGVFLEALKRIQSRMPYGVQLRENEEGTWFNTLFDSVLGSLPTVLDSAAAVAPGPWKLAALGGAAGLRAINGARKAGKKAGKRDEERRDDRKLRHDDKLIEDVVEGDRRSRPKRRGRGRRR